MKKTALALIALTSLGLVGCGKKNTKQSFSLETESEDSVLYRPQFERYSTDLNILESEQELVSVTDRKYTKIEVTYDKSKKRFNGIDYPNGVKKIFIYGKNITIDKDLNSDENEGTKNQNLYHVLKKTSDVAEVIIHAETIQINSQIELQGASVTIKAKTLSFGPQGKIVTTPMNINHPAAQFKNGINGLDGGDIHLTINKLYFSFSYPHALVTSGGNGQDAGVGSNGKKGTNAVIKYSPNYFQYRKEHCSNEPSMGRHKYRDCDWARPVTGARSGNGGNAKVGGKPGEPGNAGTIYSTISIKKFDYQSEGGKAGLSDSTRYGGAPGSPATTCAISFHYRGKKKIHSCQTANRGRDISPKNSLHQNGTSSPVVVQNRVDGDWISDAYINTQLLIIDDMFLAGNSSYALNLINELEDNIQQSNHKSMAASQALTELMAIKNKMNLRLDYYGHSKGWVPNLALEVTHTLFKKEVKRNIKNLYFAKKLQKNIENNVASIEDLKILRSNFYSDIKEASKEIKGLTQEVANTNELIDELRVSEEEFEIQLKILEEEIKKKAKKNLKVPFMDKAVKIFAAASRSIPVGQPTFGIVGAGLEFVNNATNGSMSSSDIYGQLPGMAASFKEMNWDQSMQNLNKHLDDLSPRHLPAMGSKEKSEYFKKVKDFTNPILESVTAEIGKWKQSEVSKTKLDAQIHKIKNSHPIYQKTIVKLSSLLIKREHFVKVTERLFNDAIKYNNQINQDYLMISSISDSVSESLHVDFSGISVHLNLLAARSLKNINFYQYLLHKSFHYRFLTNNRDGNFITPLLTKMEGLLDSTEVGTYAEDLEKMWVAYNSSMMVYTRDVIDNFINGSPARDFTFEYILKEEEVKALNHNKEIYIDLIENNVYGKNKEDIRLNKVEVLDGFTFENSREGNVEIVTTHIGKSIIEKNSKRFYFEQGTKNSNKQWVWISSYHQNSRNLYHSDVSVSEKTLLGAILGKNLTNTRIFSSPGGKTFLKIKLNKDENVKLGDLTLKIDYSYRDKN